MLVHIHIPKTAGSAFHTAYKKMYGAERVLWVNDRALSEIAFEVLARRPEVVIGHMPMGLHEHVDNVRYVTVVRRPLDRLRPLYRYVYRYEGHPLQTNQPFSQWLKTFARHPEVNNAQTRYLARAYLGTTASNSRAGVREIDGRRAIAAIRSAFCVGTVDALDALAIRLFGEPLDRENRSDGSVEVDSVSDGLLGDVAEYDCKLYEEVRVQCT